MKPPLPPLDPGEGPCVAADATASPETDAAAIAPFSGELRFFRTGLGGIQTCVLGPEKDSSSYYYDGLMDSSWNDGRFSVVLRCQGTCV